MISEYSYFGKYKIIDAHTHIYGPMYQKDPEVERKVKDGFLFPVVTAEELVAHMKRFGIYRFVAFPGHWTRSNLISDHLYHIPNDQISEAQKKYPDNIIGFGRVNTNYKEDAEKEARRCFEELGLKGLKVQPEVDQSRMDDIKRWRPIMELLSKYNYPLLSHTYVHWSTSSPGLFYTLAETFPDVNIIMSHAAWKYYYDAIIVAKHNDNIYLGISNIHENDIWRAVQMGLEDKLVFSTDTPHFNPALTVLKVSSHPKLTEEQKTKILGTNLAGILNIKL